MAYSGLVKIMNKLKTWLVTVCDILLGRHGLKLQLESALREINFLRDAEQSARAQLAQLRVAQETVQDRTGFMVSAFIPQGVITQLNRRGESAKRAFCTRVVAILTEHALKGIYRVSAKGKMVAMVFEPLGPNSDKRAISPIFETDIKK